MDERAFWEALRRGLLLMVAAIEARYELDPRCPTCRAARRNGRMAAADPAPRGGY